MIRVWRNRGYIEAKATAGELSLFGEANEQLNI